jgi:lysophospholipase L1-like esterase
MRWIAFALVGALSANGAHALAPDTCEAPDYVTHAEGKLPRLADAVANERRLDVLVFGTGSSILPGPEGAANAYPARLQAALAGRLQGVTVTVKTDVKTRRTTADMVSELPRIVLDLKPDLVIWQTGTVDAMRGIEPDEFRAALEKGLKKINAGGADAILVNMQYSPRTESMIASSAYVDNMRWVAQQFEVPLFDRLAVMKHWSENGAFDFTAPPPTSKLAERVHDCLGKLLADLIVDVAHINTAELKAK